MPRSVDGFKTCTKCHETKTIDMYSSHDLTFDKKRPACKACHVRTAQAYYRLDPTRTQANALRNTYNLSLDEYRARMASQDGRCSICRHRFTTEKVGGTFPCIDHDHQCCPGKKSCGACIRGIICFNCNTVLGKVHDNAETLKRAIKYLEGDT